MGAALCVLCSTDMGTWKHRWQNWSKYYPCGFQPSVKAFGIASYSNGLKMFLFSQNLLMESDLCAEKSIALITLTQSLFFSSSFSDNCFLCLPILAIDDTTIPSCKERVYLFLHWKGSNIPAIIVSAFSLIHLCGKGLLPSNKVLNSCSLVLSFSKGSLE